MKLSVADIYSYGVGKFRVSDPHLQLKNTSKKIDVSLDINFIASEFNSDAIFFHVSSHASNQIMSFIDQIKTKGVKIIVDVDDYWKLNPDHPRFNYYVRNRNDAKIIKMLKRADLITVASKNLYSEIRKITPNVVVIPNAIDKNEGQFKHRPIDKNITSFGWAGGSSHLEDIKLLRGVLSKVTNGGKDKTAQFVLGGFDDRIKQTDGKFKRDFEGTLWREIEAIITDNYSLLKDDYVNYLLSGNKVPSPLENKDVYKRIWSKPIESYGKIYNEMDIALAPLKNTEFNNMKSELKIIEAGFHGLPIVASDIPIYSQHITNDMGFLVKEKRAHKDWAKYIKALIKDEKMREEMGANLKAYCLDKFEMTKVTKMREEIYLKYL